MVHDLFPFLIVAAIVCGGVLVFLYIDHLRTERRWRECAARIPIPESAYDHLALMVVRRNLPPPGTPDRFAGFIFKRIKKVGNFFAYAWVRHDRREGGTV